MYRNVQDIAKVWSIYVCTYVLMCDGRSLETFTSIKCSDYKCYQVTNGLCILRTYV